MMLLLLCACLPHSELLLHDIERCCVMLLRGRLCRGTPYQGRRSMPWMACAGWPTTLSSATTRTWRTLARYMAVATHTSTSQWLKHTNPSALPAPEDVTQAYANSMAFKGRQGGCRKRCVAVFVSCFGQVGDLGLDHPFWARPGSPDP
jgi:hypothetical protein